MNVLKALSECNWLCQGAVLKDIILQIVQTMSSDSTDKERIVPMAMKHKREHPLSFREKDETRQASNRAIDSGATELQL